MPAPIERRLRTVDPETGKTEVIDEASIEGLPSPIVILGDPGQGKSTLTQKLGSQRKNRYVRAGTFVRSKAPATFLPPTGGRLVIDGMDEIASAIIGGGLDAVLEQLSAIGNPSFILSSREADWSGASSRIRIEDDYGQAASVLHLEAFDRSDADAYLRSFFPDVDAKGVLDHLATHGLDELYRNPLTLRMIGEVAGAETILPRTRGELLQRACIIMLQEKNPRHHRAAHALRSVEGLLLAAGAICACLLLCDRSGVYAGATSGTPEDFLHLSSVLDLPLADAASEALRTRLFQADGESRFIPSHRVIAEYLGARWIAACFDRGTSEHRIRPLITLSGGVPTSLRGLNAWLPNFSSALAPYSIAADPYAVLRYGNAETLPLEQARTLLHELAKLSSADPYFRAEDWNRHPAAGLMRLELKDDILALLSDEKTHAHLVLLLLEAMVGSLLGEPLRQDLEAILFNPERVSGSRSRAAAALISSGALVPTEPAIRRLLVLGDRESRRLAFEILTKRGLTAIPMHLAVETLLANAGMTVSPIERKQRESAVYIQRDIITALNGPELHTFLDTLTEYAAPLIHNVDHHLTESIADAARIAVLSALRSDTPVTAEQVWRWLHWLRDHDGHDTKIKEQLRQHFNNNTCLRRSIQAEALLKASKVELRAAAFDLSRVSSGLRPDDGDVVALINLLNATSDGSPDLLRLRDLIFIGRTRAGLAPSIREAALNVAGPDPDLIKTLDEGSKPFIDEYEQKQKRRLAAAEAKRKKTYQQIRVEHATNIDAIRAGDVGWLNQDAKVYLGRFSEFDKADKPEVRVEKFLGAELADDVFSGFMSALFRNDLPTASEIAQLHAENREWKVEVVLVCGIAEMLRRSIPLNTVKYLTLVAAYMAWRRQNEANIGGGIEIGPELEAVVLADEMQAESFFRTSIEPQLKAGLAYIQDLYLLTNGQRWPVLAGKLAIDWLIQNPTLSLAVEKELLDAAVRHGNRHDIGRLVAAVNPRVHPNCEALLEWLATDFVIDFDRTKPHLADAARDHCDFLWPVRDRVTDGRHGPFIPLTIDQRAFIVEAFASSWPHASRPEGSWSGSTNPWDATEFIEHAIDSLATEPVREATNALGRLSGSATSYSDRLRHALAVQRRLRRDHEYVPASVAQVQSVVSNALPETIDDMRAYFGDRVATVQERMHATNTDMWEAYWDGTKPRPENFCRNRLIEHISGQLPSAVRFEPEMHMPNQKRADIAAIRDAIGLPVEIKGQWHKEVWHAPMEQLAARYGRDWHAEGRGAYIVIWFGDVPRKKLPAHPDDLASPKTPEELRTMLINRIPEAMRDLIDVYVVDVTRMR
jgi:hypothetical protein